MKAYVAVKHSKDGDWISVKDFQLVCDERNALMTALKALVAETEAKDNPSDMGVSRDEPVMVAALAAIAKVEATR